MQQNKSPRGENFYPRLITFLWIDVVSLIFLTFKLEIDFVAPSKMETIPLNETRFENRLVSARNLVGGYIKQRVGGQQRSLSFLSFLPFRETPLLAGNQSAFFANLTLNGASNKVAHNRWGLNLLLEDKLLLFVENFDISGNEHLERITITMSVSSQ